MPADSAATYSFPEKPTVMLTLKYEFFLLNT